MTFQGKIERDVGETGGDAVSPARLRKIEETADAGSKEALRRGMDEQGNRQERRAANAVLRAQPTFSFGRSFGRDQRTYAKLTEGGYTIEGLVPRTSSAVWFGESGIGKTMLTIWKALCIAARGPNAPKTWCGQKIQRRGIVIIYSGEDSMIEAFERIDDMATKLLGLEGAELQDTVERVLFINPADLPPSVFTGLDASLFEKSDGRYHPSGNAEGVLSSIRQINSEATKDDERVAGVFQDSATSVSGFDAMEGEAVSRYFFFVSQACRENRIFWIVLGHISQEAKLDPYNPEYRARYRLRGVVVWITAPRLVVEVRVPLGANKSKPSWSECLEALERNIAARPEDLLTVTVVKANGKDVCRRKLWIRWSNERVFDDVSLDMTGVARSREQYDAKKARDKIEQAAGNKDLPLISRDEASDAVLAMCRHLSAKADGKGFTMSAVEALCKAWKKDTDQLEEHPILIAKPANGGLASNQGDDYSVTWHIKALVSTGELAKSASGRGYDIAAAVEDPDLDDEAPQVEEADRSPALGAVLQIARTMATGEPGVRITGATLQARAESTRWQEQFPVLAKPVDAGGLKANHKVAGAPAKFTWHWALDQLVASDLLIREIGGHYSVPGATTEVADAPTDMPAVDLEPAFEAIAAIVEHLAKFPEPVTAKEVQKLQRASFWQTNYPVLARKETDGGFALNSTNSSREPRNQSPAWFLDSLVERGNLLRLHDGSYVLPKVAANDADDRNVA